MLQANLCVPVAFLSCVHMNASVLPFITPRFHHHPSAVTGNFSLLYTTLPTLPIPDAEPQTELAFPLVMAQGLSLPAPLSLQDQKVKWLPLSPLPPLPSHTGLQLLHNHNCYCHHTTLQAPTGWRGQAGEEPPAR